MPMKVGLQGDVAQPLSSLQSKCPKKSCCVRGRAGGARVWGEAGASAAHGAEGLLCPGVLFIAARAWGVPAYWKRREQKDVSFTHAGQH